MVAGMMPVPIKSATAKIAGGMQKKGATTKIAGRLQSATAQLEAVLLRNTTANTAG